MTAILIEDWRGRLKVHRTIMDTESEHAFIARNAGRIELYDCSMKSVGSNVLVDGAEEFIAVGNNGSNYVAQDISWERNRKLRLAINQACRKISMEGRK